MNMSSVELDLAVCQAQGMICAQVGCTFGEALVLIRERAQVSGQGMEEIADGVVERRIRFR